MEEIRKYKINLRFKLRLKKRHNKIFSNEKEMYGKES